MGGAAGAGTSGRPFSPPRGEAKEEVSILCARSSPAIRWPRSTTGTRWRSPIWRAPVYRTPGWIIAIAQLCRFTWWLARLVVRHPVVSLVLAVLGFTWSETGWLGVTLLAVWAVLVLVCWRVLWPVSFARRAGSPARVGGGRAVPAAVGVGDDDLRAGPVVSGADRPAGARQGPLHPLRQPGPRPAGVGPVRRAGRRRRRQPGARVRRDAVPGPRRPGPVRCCWSSSAATPWPQVVPPAPVQAYPRPAGPGSRPPRGRAAVAGPAARHPRADRRARPAPGKASLLWGLVRAMFPLHATTAWCGCWPLTRS